MGIQDRDYYRKNSFNSFGGLAGGYSAAGILTTIYSAVFVVELLTSHGGSSPFAREFWLDPQKILEGEIWRIFTGFWLQPPAMGALLWVVCNILIVWWAGKEISAIYGDREFISSYLAMAILCSLAVFLYGMISGDRKPVLLVSAPISGLLTLFALHHPRHTILLFYILPVNIWICVGFIVFKDFVLLNNPQSDGLASVLADFTALGLAFGYYHFHWRTMPLLQSLNIFKAAQRRSRLRVYRDRETPVGQPVPPVLATISESNDKGKPIPDEQLEARLDEVLAKVQKFGQSHLTEAERELLFRASEIYRKRRGGVK
jgi:membrane associated rhomboid family serine protease